MKCPLMTFVRSQGGTPKVRPIRPNNVSRCTIWSHKKRDRSLSWGKHDRCTQIRGVWGKSWVHNTARRSQRGWLNGADDTECHETLGHPASARFLVYSLLKINGPFRFFGVFLASFLCPHQFSPILF